MKKKIGLVLVVIMMLLTLTGCGKKTVISTDTFISKLKSQGYQIADVTDQYAEYSYINRATVAKSQEGWQIEFYELDNKDNAEGMFNNNKSIFEESTSGASTEASVNMINYSTYSLTSGGYYMYLCRVDNTLLYAKVSDQYKDIVKNLVKELGY